MGVTDASKWLRERITPIAETEDTIMDHLRERTPDGDGLAFIVDGGRFAHATIARLSRNDATVTPADIALDIANDITGRCHLIQEAPLFVVIDDYTRENMWKGDTVTARAKAVGSNFILDRTKLHNPVLDSEKLQGLYGSRESRLAIYTTLKDIMTWGHTAFTDVPHCISMDPTEPQFLVKRCADINLGYETIEFDTDLHIDLDRLIDTMLRIAGPTAHCIPRKLILHASVDATTQILTLTLDMGGVVKHTQIEAYVDNVQWLPFKFTLEKHTLVVNITSVGEFIDDGSGTLLLRLAPTVCIDLFEHLPCPQLRSQPIESDFSSIEFAAALAAEGKDTVVLCAEDCDWTMFAGLLQRGILDKGLDVEIITHNCPAQRKRAADFWVDNRRVAADHSLRVSLLWYLLSPHDYSTGIASVGTKGRLTAMQKWQTSDWQLPFEYNAACPSRMKINEVQCLRVAQSALVKDRALRCHLFNGKKEPLPEKRWLDGAVHPLRVVSAAMWPLDGIQL